jgi:sulfopyruvate decarboxylase TPP-binding subunit
MDPQSGQLIIETLKEEDVDMVVTLPEEPTFSLTEAIREDSYFTSLTVAAEGNGIALCAGAALGGRRVMFVTGIAGLMVGTWALAQSAIVYGVPMLIMASYRGDIGDHSGIPGSQLLLFKQVAEPLLDTLRVPYRVIDKKSDLKRSIRDANFAAHDYSSPVVVLLTGEVLW